MRFIDFKLVHYDGNHNFNHGVKKINISHKLVWPTVVWMFCYKNFEQWPFKNINNDKVIKEQPHDEETLKKNRWSNITKI